MITRFFFSTPKMSSFLLENHRDTQTLTLLNVLVVPGVLNVLNVLAEYALYAQGSIMNMLGLFLLLNTELWPQGPLPDSDLFTVQEDTYGPSAAYLRLRSLENLPLANCPSGNCLVGKYILQISG